MPAATAVAVAAVAGLVAAGPMLLVMEALKRPESPVPPHRVGLRIGATAGVVQPMTPLERRVFTGVSHFAYGAGAAAPFGLVTPRGPAAGAVAGAAWGLAVWAASYSGWLPAAGILPPPWRRSTRRNANLIAAHVAWGVLVGVTTASIGSRR